MKFTEGQRVTIDSVFFAKDTAGTIVSIEADKTIIVELDIPKTIAGITDKYARMEKDALLPLKEKNVPRETVQQEQEQQEQTEDAEDKILLLTAEELPI